MIDPSLLSLVAKAVESAIANALKFDPGTHSKLDKLEGTSICIDISDFKLWFVAQIADRHIRISILPADAEEKSQFDISIIGAFSDLVGLATKKNHSLADSGVVAEGKVGLLEAIQDIAQNIDIDWQDALAQKLPAPLANLILGPFLSALKSAKEFSGESVKNTAQQFSDYAQYESGLVVTTDEFQAFKSGVKTLRERTERLDAKIKHFIQGQT